MKLVRPPYETNADGEARRVGVEIEFANLSVRQAADMLTDLFGGEVRQWGPHQCQVVETRYGTFAIEIDTRFAHMRKVGDAAEENGLERSVRELFGDVASIVVPAEIAGPPVGLDDLPEMDRIIGGLREAGAHGTADSPFYGFGLQLNVETASLEVRYILGILRAYILLSDWLRERVNIDATRWLVGYADPFPKHYARRVLDPAYDPDLAKLIEDYLLDNETRNRELDLLPLFAYLDRSRIQRRMRGKGVKARPAFHYRLPNAQLDEADWGVVKEWNRWVTVERLAADERRLRRMAEAFLVNDRRIFPRDWARISRRWVDE